MFLRAGRKISGANNMYLVLEASGNQNCTNKVTGISKMTVNFVILNDFFDTWREKQEEKLY